MRARAQISNYECFDVRIVAQIRSTCFSAELTLCVSSAHTESAVQHSGHHRCLCDKDASDDVKKMPDVAWCVFVPHVGT